MIDEAMTIAMRIPSHNPGGTDSGRRISDVITLITRLITMRMAGTSNSDGGSAGPLSCFSTIVSRLTDFFFLTMRGGSRGASERRPAGRDELLPADFGG